MIQEFKPGGVVILNSGDPDMTIQRFVGQENSNERETQSDKLLKFSLHNQGDAICQWFEKNELNPEFLNSPRLNLNNYASTF